ncbi:DUF3649 domain-containing protein [Stenotrophomonas sp.]|uniref:DUF3649 domain-containing protein n=1 Tax=Stenotrophomonas sp. TaxID=69392 RepID=UPI00289978EE|nr:DUF3649 domain-containing protein [Stenotrophomonas sp.]
MSIAPSPVSPARRTSSRRTGNAQLWARGLLALIGGYAVAAAWADGLARILPGNAADAALVATMASFVVYALAAIWTYAARSTARAALGVALAFATGALPAALHALGFA